MNNQDWLDQIYEEELLGLLAPSLRSYIRSSFAHDLPLDSVGMNLGSLQHLGLVAKGGSASGNIWNVVKSEFYKLTCTGDAAYEDLRMKLHGESDVSERFLVAAIAGGLGAALGWHAGLLAPLVVILLLMAVRMGKEALCKSLSGES